MKGRFVRTKDGSKEVTWEQILTTGHRPLRVVRTVFARLPADPRCRLCIAPFGGFGGRMSGMFGFGPSRMNPNYCAKCLENLPPGGAEVDMAVLFADVRSSTELGGSVNPTEFARLMNQFYAFATQTLVRHDALIDKLIGDEVMALFLPGLCGPEYRAKACAAALELLKTVQAELPALSVGAGVHSGVAFVGNVGGEGVFDFTALGDTINVGARLQSVATAGELVVSEETFPFAGDLGATVARNLEVKGKAEPVAVRVARVA